MITFSFDRNFKIPSFVGSCKSLAIFGLLFYILSILLSSNNLECQLSQLVKETSLSYDQTSLNTHDNNSPTNINHLVFAIAGTVNGLRVRKQYIETWWKPNITRGYIFLDRDMPNEFLPWQPSLPLFRVSYDMSKLKVYKKHVMPMIIRIVRMVVEAYREGDRDARWYVMGDDDTIFFTENLVDVLRKYDHRKYYYIGATSESTKSNFDHSFEMAFGGGGVALSNALVAALDTKLDDCIQRYWNLYVSDHVLQLCLADFGVSLTQEKGFHQIDLHNDLSGFLTAHPPTPVLSLHHLDGALPIFPERNRFESVNHLMKPANVDQPRLLQQAICYQKQNNWTFSVSWGYMTHIYESIFPRSFLKKPLETFWPWRKNHRPFYTFNIRFMTNDPCQAPHSFFLDSIENGTYGDQIVTTYKRFWNRSLPACSESGNHSADFIDRIQVFSPAKRQSKNENRRECCDIIRLTDTNVTEIKFRDCFPDEVIA